MKTTTNRTYLMFPKRSFWTGFSSVFSIFGESSKFNYSKSGAVSDFNALKSDWEMIGQDIRKVMSENIKLTSRE